MMHTTEITQRAKQYLDSLAQGIDPISKKKIPPDSVLNQEQLSRCFLYVSGVLQTVLAQDGITPAPASSWDPLLASGALDRFEYSEQPLSLHQFAVQLNSLRGSSPAKALPKNALTSWLLHEGFLTAAAGTAGKGTAYDPVSKRGEAIGISSNSSHAEQNGRPHLAILFHETAQRFLVYSLDRIIAYHQAGWARRLALVNPDKIPYSAHPVLITDFLRILNGAAGWTSPNWINVLDLNGWLLKEGYLAEHPGKTTTLFPTRKGEEIGVSRVRGTLRNKNLEYTQVVYTEAGQRFIVSHLRDIVLL